MGTHTAPVNRAGSNASDTTTAIAFAWQVGPGTGTNPVDASDFPGGVYPSGTGTIPVGSASTTITFNSNPDTTFEPDETGVVILTSSQSGVTVTGSPQPFIITNDDADPGTGVEKYNATTNSMPATDAGGPHYKLETLLQTAQDYTVNLGGSAGMTGARIRIKPNGVNNTNQQGGSIASNGTTFAVFNTYNNLAHNQLTTAGLPAIFEVNGTNLKVTIDGVVIFNSGIIQNADVALPAGNFVSFTTGGTAKPTKLTLLP